MNKQILWICLFAGVAAAIALLWMSLGQMKACTTALDYITTHGNDPYTTCATCKILQNGGILK